MTGVDVEAGGERVTIAGDRAGGTVYAVELPTFEGPLDLLLHLVRRHELDILTIPIAFVAEKYLEYLSVMQALDLEIAGEYLVMAATLAYLKSRELLPQIVGEGEGEGEGDEEGEDPREALIRRLIEYERFRAAGAELEAMPVVGRDVFNRGGDVDLPPLDPGMAPVTLYRLAEAYARVLQRAKINKSHEVTIEAVTVRQRMEQLSLILDAKQSIEFESLFLSRTWSSIDELRAMLVVTLMSVLEMVKLGLIGVHQADASTTIRINRRASHQETVQALSGYDEEASYGVGAGPPGPPRASPPAPTPRDEGHGDGDGDSVAAEAGAVDLAVATPGRASLIVPRVDADPDDAPASAKPEAPGREESLSIPWTEVGDLDEFDAPPLAAELTPPPRRIEESLSVPWSEAIDESELEGQAPVRSIRSEESLSIPWTEADPSEWGEEAPDVDGEDLDEEDDSAEVAVRGDEVIASDARSDDRVEAHDRVEAGDRVEADEAGDRVEADEQAEDDEQVEDNEQVEADEQIEVDEHVEYVDQAEPDDDDRDEADEPVE